MEGAYSPNLGRWINRDPIQEYGGTNLYKYVGNSPVRNSDPSGLFGQSVSFAAPPTGGGGFGAGIGTGGGGVGGGGGGFGVGAGGGGDPDDDCRSRAQDLAAEDYKNSGESQRIMNKYNEIEDQLQAQKERELANLEDKFNQEKKRSCSKSRKKFKPPQWWLDKWQRTFDTYQDAEADEIRAATAAYFRKWLDLLGCGGPRPY